MIHVINTFPEMPCQVVLNKISLDPIPDELKDLKKAEKNNFQENNILKNSKNAWKRGICKN